MTIKAYKGFDKNLQCRGFQFEVGKTYTHDGKVEACESGFHAIEGNPLEVFGYYAPAQSRFCLVDLDGDMARHSDDSKVAAQILTVGTEIGISDLVRDAVKFVMDRSSPEGEMATGYQGAASSTGYRGAASSTGYRGAASSTGDQGAASSTGDQGAASSTGYQGAASVANGSAAMTNGSGGMVMGETDGCPLYCAERKGSYPFELISVACGVTGRDGVKSGTWYQCENGKLVEVSK